MRWCRPGLESAFDELSKRLNETPWPGPPEGWRLLAEPRPMRVVVAGTWPPEDGGSEAVIKWHRPDGMTDVLARHLRGGRGPREGEVLQRLAEAEVPAPEPLAFQDDEVDVLVTRAETGLEPLPPADTLPSQLLEAGAAVLAKAHDAGLRHRDLHAGNVALRDGEPFLVDLGGARVGGPHDEESRIHELARAVHGLLGGTRRTQRLRALRAYLAARMVGNPVAEARRLATTIERAAHGVRRRYRLGRDRRALRTGKHFEQFAAGSAARGVRCKDTCDASLRERAAGWLDERPDGAVALKGGGDVVRVGDLVVKYYDAVAASRLPRPLRAFRTAYALQNRGVAVPAPVLACAREDGSGLYVAAHVPAPDLQRAVDEERLDGATLHRLGRALRLMHDAEVTHRDLKAPNILLAEDGSFPIVDLEGARVRRRPVRWSRRARDLMRLDASLDLPTDVRLHTVQGYYDVLPRPPMDLADFAARVAELAAHKRGPSGRPR